MFGMHTDSAPFTRPVEVWIRQPAMLPRSNLNSIFSCYDQADLFCSASLPHADKNNAKKCIVKSNGCIKIGALTRKGSGAAL
jgi:hypothetical protein